MSDEPKNNLLTIASVLPPLAEHFKKHSVNGVCGLCGQRSRRDVVGFRWLEINDALGFNVGVPSDGALPCAVLACVVCGLISYLNLVQAGIVQRVNKGPKPTFTLIKGGADDTDA